MTEDIYPLRFKPVYKDYIWGGDKIVRLYKRDEPSGVYAESWEVADRPEGMSVVDNGPLAGTTLHSLVETLGKDLLGTRVQASVFPLLIKLIDARERLSVQVHPDDAAALQFGGEAKTEMWHVLDADHGAKVFAGLKPDVDQGMFMAAVDTGLFEEVLSAVPVTKGDTIFIPGGRVHAIGAGCLLLEVQQNSNTTFRIHDWGRTGRNGMPRDLHVEEALRVIRWDDTDDARVMSRRLDTTGRNEVWEVLTTPYFCLEKLVLSEAWMFLTLRQSFHILFVVEGRVEVKAEGMTEALGPGSTCLVPAFVNGYDMSPVEHPCMVLRITGPGQPGRPRFG